MSTLNSQIFQPGTKFIVTPDSKDNTYGPGTTGFVSYVEGRDRDYKNVVSFRAVIIRRGKGGKERLNIVKLSTPIFYFNNKKLREKLLPDELRSGYIHIEPVKVDPNLLSLASSTPMDYIGWALSYASYVKKLSSVAQRRNTKGGTTFWPKTSKHILNRIIDLQNDNFEGNPSEAKNYFASATEVLRFVEKVRVIESGMTAIALTSMQRIAEIEFNAAASIISGGVKTSAFSLAATRDLYLKKSKNLGGLAENFGKNKPVKTPSHLVFSS